MNGKAGRERGAKDLNLRPFAARGGAQGLDMSLPAGELLEQESAKPDKQIRLLRGTAQPLGEARREPLGDERRGTSSRLQGDGARRRRPLTEREKLALARQRKLNRFISLCVAAVAALAALLLTWFLLIVDDIAIEGNARLSAEQIIAASGLKTGRHTWLINLADAKERIEEDPYVESAQIARVYPDKLLVTVVEREEAAVIVGLNAQAVIDPQGYVLSIGARADYAGLIRISGMGSGGYHVGQRLGEESDFYARTLVALLEAIYGAGIEDDIDYVDMSNPLSVYMATTGGLTLHIGQPDDLANKLSNYLAVLPKLNEMGLASSGTLDLGAMGDPVYSPEGEGSTLPEGGTPDPAGGTPDPAGPSPTPGGADPSGSPSPTPNDTEDGFSG
ncbi:MAG TPA: FtsQ-type POTRA domain-containing protein [Clostridia bacterium]|nr:FtsQ-type POTRA domain-containing protein [Clostridia bacterium]